MPATLSGKMIDLTRTELDFHGLIMADSLSKGAITDCYNDYLVYLLNTENGFPWRQGKNECEPLLRC